MSPWPLFLLLSVMMEADALTAGTTAERIGDRINSWLVSVAAGAGRLGSAISGGHYGGYSYASAAAAPPSYASTSFVSRQLQAVRVSGGQLSAGLTSGSVSVGLAVGGAAASGGRQLQLLGSTAAVAPGAATAVSFGRRQGDSAAAAVARAGPAISTVARCGPASCNT